MPDHRKPLLEVAKQYKSIKDFKARNLPKYLLAKRKGLLRIAFPKDLKPPEPIRGIYYLYKRNKVIYIGHSTINALEAIQEHADGPIPFTSYKLFKLASDSDITTLSLYLANKFRPLYNTNLGKQRLSYEVEGVAKLLGKPIKEINV